MRSYDWFRPPVTAIALAGALALMGAPRASYAQEHLGRGRVAGIVLDENGTPIEGAEVLAKSREAKTTLEGKTDRRGRFAIAGFGTGVWALTVSKPGYLSSSIEVEVRQLRANAPIELRLKAASPASAGGAASPAAESLERGVALFDQGQHDEALVLFEEYAAKNPDSYQVHIDIGRCRLRQGDLERAEAESALVLAGVTRLRGSYQQDAATSARALSLLGEVALKRNDLPAALGRFKQAFDLCPEDERLAYNVGEILFANGSPDEAVKYFEAALRIAPSWSKPRYRLGVVHLSRNDLARSLDSLKAFVAADPTSPDAASAREMVAAIERLKP